MKNTYLVRVMSGPMAGTLKTASLEEWVAILRKNKGLPPESRRYFIIDCIIEDEELDRMYIEVDREAYDEWHRDNQAAYRNRIIKNLFLHLSLDAVVDNAEGVTLHDTISSGYSLEEHASSNMNMTHMPTEMKDSLRSSLWTSINTHFALTSGTMKDDTGFSFFKSELGITGCLDQYSVSEFSCESPFDYQNHTRLYISEDTPIPDMRDPEYIPAVAREVVKLVKATNGHTAVLFTSYKALNAVFELVKDELKEYPLIKMSRSNKTAITQFKDSGNGVLFASGSMWEGVDCAGDILSSVIIVRLPFPLRSQTMEFKKMSCKNTKEFVRKYAVPQMIIKLRQGAGRLIRNETDTGVLAILDARAAQDGAYRTRVLNTLRKYPLVSSISDVASFIDSVKDESYKKEVPCG